MIYAKYRLKKDLPELKAGAIFEHRKYDSNHPDRGNYGTGCLILGWINGDCQQGWCGETYVFPGQLANNKDWFEKINSSCQNEKNKLLKKIKELEEHIKKL